MSANPSFSGSLAETPVFAALRRIAIDKLTGTLVLSHQDHTRHLLFKNGCLRVAMSSQPEHRLGAHLQRWGYVSELDLNAALEDQKRTMARLDAILIERGLVPAETLHTEMKRLMQMVLFSTFSWRDGEFEFRPGIEDDVLEGTVSISTESLIVEGIRRSPDSPQVLEYLGDLSRVPTACTDLMSREGLELAPDIGHVVGLVDGKTDTKSLLRMAGGTQLSSAKALYALVYAGLVSLDGTCARPAPASAARPSAAAAPAAALSSADRERRKLVMNTHGRLAWLSHYDVLGVEASATTAQIEAAYDTRKELFRPDQDALADCTDALRALSARVRRARDVLSEPAARSAYDREVHAGKVLTQQAQPDLDSKEARQLRSWTASQNYKRAMELVALKDFFPAIQMLEQAVSFVPDNSEYRYKLGTLQRKNPHWLEKAIENLREAVRLDPIRPEALGELAGALLQAGRAGEARPYAAQAHKLAPDSAEYTALDEKVGAAGIQEAAAPRTTSTGFLSRFTRGQ